MAGSDPDGDDLTWALTTTGSPFAIGADGTITTTEALDHETKDSYTLTVRASDGTASTDAEVTVSVANVNDAPVIVSVTPASIAGTVGEPVDVDLTVVVADEDDDDVDLAVTRPARRPERHRQR